MKINKLHGRYNITKRSQQVRYIVLHYVGSGTPSDGNARNNCLWFGSGDKQASAHYFVDDGGIWEYADPSKYYTWHCGDGHGKYGISNANSIGIEVCQDGDRPYTAKEIKFLKQLVPYLMIRFGVPASHVVRHYDASRKLCPYYYAKRDSEWVKLRKSITTKKSTAKTKTVKTTTQIAQEVIDGKWGTGEERKKKLRQAGYDSDEIQKNVNAILKAKTTKKKSNTAIAKEVIEGKWGTGETRKRKLTQAGYDYNEIQKLVNKLVK